VPDHVKFRDGKLLFHLQWSDPCAAIATFLNDGQRQAAAHRRGVLWQS
jgi:hypothetical protein